MKADRGGGKMGAARRWGGSPAFQSPASRKASAHALYTGAS